MRKKQRWYKRWNAQIMLFLIVTSFLLGFFGYWEYYRVTCWNVYSIYSDNTTQAGASEYDRAEQDEKNAVALETDIAGSPDSGVSEGMQDDRRPLLVFWRPLFSTFKLFGGVFDASVNEKLEQAVIENNGHIRTALYCLLLARWLAWIPAGITVIALVMKLFPSFWTKLRYFCWSKKQKRLLLIGNNEENIRLYRATYECKSGMILSESGKDTAPLRDQGLRYYTPENDEYNASEDNSLKEELTSQLERVLMSETATIDVIINTLNEEWNLRLCRAAVECIHNAVDKDKKAADQRMKELETDRAAQLSDPELCRLRRIIVEKLERIKIYVFGEKQHEQLYLALEDISLGTVHYTNRYHLGSFDFVSRYPLTKYLPDHEGALEADGCVAANVAFNVIFVGFGDMNREVFLDSFVVNQFIVHDRENIPKLKQVNYYIFDKRSDALHDKNLNHTLFRYVDDFKPLFDPKRQGHLNEDDYLELPPTPLHYIFLDKDINSEAFYDEVQEICRKKNRASNYLIIAFGDDFENTDLAQRLVEKKSEWGISDLHIFVKIRNRKNAEVASLLSDGQKDTYIPFGNEEFTLEQVLHNEIEDIAYERKKQTLNKEGSDTDSDRMNDDTVRVLYSWYTMSQFMRRSNIYNILALRMKLQLLGLDYEKVDNPGLAENSFGQVLNQKEYFDLYARGCVPEKSRDSKRYRGAMFDYDNYTIRDDYKKLLPRRNLVVQEHYRWNAYMIKCGFIPPTKAEVENGFVKDYRRLRKHANLSSFEALFDFRDIRERKTSPGEKPEDVIGYDYKLMDEAWFFLNACGYQIIRQK